MRHIFKTKPVLNKDSNKIITKFLWFPLVINKELRWLEKTTIEYKTYMDYVIIEGFGVCENGYKWMVCKFINK